MEKQFFVYILYSNNHKVAYTGVTNNLIRRVWEHKNKLIEGFTSQYNVNKLVYYEIHNTAEEAIKREKSIKGKRSLVNLCILWNL